MREPSLFAFPALSILNDSIKDDHALAFRLPPKSNSLLEAFRRLEEGRKDGQSTQFHFGRWQFGAPDEIRNPDLRTRRLVSVSEVRTVLVCDFCSGSITSF
jgi:hypothetical protein